MHRITIISLAVFALFLASAGNSYGCGCRAPDNPLKEQVADAYGGSAAVFSGRVVEVTSQDDVSVTVRIKVARMWKGKFSKLITITTAKDSSMCGYIFESEKTYLIYAYGTMGKLATDSCSRTALSASNRDPVYLDRLKKRAKGK